MRSPGIRHLVRLLGGVPIPTTAHAMGAFAQAVRELLERGEVVHLFPEGILAPYYDGVREFHRGAFTFACESQVPVIPFVISYCPVPPERPFHKKPYLHLHVLPPVYPRSGVNRREESERLRLLCMEQMRRQYALDMQAQKRHNIKNKKSPRQATLLTRTLFV